MVRVSVVVVLWIFPLVVRHVTTRCLCLSARAIVGIYLRLGRWLRLHNLRLVFFGLGVAFLVGFGVVLAVLLILGRGLGELVVGCGVSVMAGTTVCSGCGRGSCATTWVPPPDEELLTPKPTAPLNSRSSESPPARGTRPTGR